MQIIQENSLTVYCEDLSVKFFLGWVRLHSSSTRTTTNFVYSLWQRTISHKAFSIAIFIEKLILPFLHNFSLQQLLYFIFSCTCYLYIIRLMYVF